MSKGKTLNKIVLAGALALSIASNTASAETYEHRKPYFTKALDGSNVLVIEQPDKGFIFYRDRDNDGWADSKGSGFYWFGISKRFEEYDLPQKRYRMENLK